MKKKSLCVNAVLNSLKSCLSIIFPLITYPYILRILGALNVGKVTYTASIVNYFILIATLGLNQYAVREGAKIRSDKSKINTFVSEIFTINIISTVIAYICLLFFYIHFENLHSYGTLIGIQSTSILFTAFNLEWVNSIYEDYLYITIRTIASYIIGMVFIFLCIHTEKDYLFYAIIQIIPVVLVCISNWLYCRKYVHLKIAIGKRITHHIKHILYFFVNNIAVQIYVNIDMTMIGWQLGDIQAGLYSIAVKIYTLLKSILAAIYTVTIPRLSSFSGEKNWKEYQSLFSNIISALLLILVPVMTGIICYAKEIVLIVGGNQYIPSIPALKVLGVALIFAILGGLTTVCLNVTLGRERENLIATIIGAIINAGLNLWIIPHYSITGAAITTLLAEVFVFLYCFIRIPDKSKYLNYIYVLKNFVQSIGGAIIVVMVSLVLHRFQTRSILSFCIAIFISVMGYVFELLLLRNGLIENVMKKPSKERKSNE